MSAHCCTVRGAVYCSISGVASSNAYCTIGRARGAEAFHFIWSEHCFVSPPFDSLNYLPAVLHVRVLAVHSVSRYDGAMELSIHVVWKMIPAAIERRASEMEDGLDMLNRWGFLYTIATSVALAAATGACVKYLGFPGGLPDVIKNVHKTGFVPMEQTLPMIFASLFSIAAGGSVGPEAPLAAVSASVTGWLSRRYFKHDVAMVRKCTIIGMSAGLSALFGVQLGGKRTCHVVWLTFVFLLLQTRKDTGINCTAANDLRVEH